MRSSVVVVASLAVALALSGCRRAPAAPGAEPTGAATVPGSLPPPAAAAVADAARTAEEHLLAGRFADAASALRAARAAGADAWRQADLAFALAMAGQADEAIRVAEAALVGARPEVAAALHYDLALAYRAKGDPSRAAAELARADALRPDPRLRAARQVLLDGTSPEPPALSPVALGARRTLPSAPVRGDDDLDWWLVQQRPGPANHELLVFTACEDLGSWCQTALVAVQRKARDALVVRGRVVVGHEADAAALVTADRPDRYRLRTALRRGVKARWREVAVELREGVPTLVAPGAPAGAVAGGRRTSSSGLP